MFKKLDLVLLLSCLFLLSACSNGTATYEDSDFAVFGDSYDEFPFAIFDSKFNNDDTIYTLVNAKDASEKSELIVEILGQDTYYLFPTDKTVKQITTYYGSGDRGYFTDNDGTMYQFDNTGTGVELVDSISNVEKFSIGGMDTIFALTNNGELYGWGQNSFGEVGNGSAHEAGLTLIMNDIKEYYLFQDIGFDETENSAEESYYYCAALTNSGELYTWAPSDSVEGLWVKENNKITLSASNVASFETVSDGIIATLTDGEELKIGPTPVEEVIEETEGYLNNATSNNVWDPIFNQVLEQLDASYALNEVSHIFGKVQNNTDSRWSNVKLKFALYDQNKEFVRNIDIVSDSGIEPGESGNFETEHAQLMGLGIYYFELVEASPFGL
ncbi:FxLYD domain-containing protein [Solibacillus sp. FSL K6-1554]|uniref:FxLYD domain-containing protein n=1 Tax=Solibacillus sp. FSL K6-1554 TaxID=2921472 RepID=UPI0030F5BADA